MNYIVFDLEWNQAGYGRPMIREPLPLEGEIIEIGALRLNEDLAATGEFKAYIRPVAYKKMNKKVQQITHITDEDLLNGETFAEAANRFSAFCGSDFALVTWGSDDMRVLRQNMAYKKFPADWLPKNVYDLQLVFDRTMQNKNETSLSGGMSYYNISADERRPAHDALNDAYYTALVMRKIGVEAIRQLYSSQVIPKRSGEIGRTEMFFYGSRRRALSTDKLQKPSCPLCGAKLKSSQWLESGGGRYMTIAQCQKDGELFLKVRFKRMEDDRLSASVTYFEDGAAYREMYESKLNALNVKDSGKRPE